MSSFNPGWYEATDAHITKRLAQMGGSGPGVVVSYDSASETATVRLGTHRLLPDASNPDLDEVEEFPPVYSVPVAWPRGRGFSCVGGLAAGDPVLLVACARDISAWRRTGEPSAPDDARLHPHAAVVAIPGLQGDAGTPARFEAPTDAAALASKLDLFGRTVAALVDATDPTSAVTAVQGILLAARAVWGGSTPASPGDLPTDSVASTILKVDE